MLKISKDPITRMIQMDIHQDMQEKGVENFYEHTAEILGCEINTVRNLMKRGNFTAQHLLAIKNKTKAEHLSKLMINTFARTEC
jgi:hypothetical protein